MLIYLVVAVSC